MLNPGVDFYAVSFKNFNPCIKAYEQGGNIPIKDSGKNDVAYNNDHTYNDLVGTL